MSLKKRISIFILAAFAFALASSAGITSPIIRYASVVIKPGAPTAGNGFQADRGVIYVDRTTGVAYVKTGSAATAWTALTAVSGAGAFSTLTASTSLTVGGLGLFSVSGTGGVDIDISTEPTTTALSVTAGGGQTALDVTGPMSTSLMINEGGWTALTQASNQDITNLQDQNSDTFAYSVTLNVAYAINCRLFAAGSNQANDFEFRLAVSAGVMTGRGSVVHINAADAIATTQIAAAAAANTNQIAVGTYGTTALPTPADFTFSFVPTATGTFRVQFGNNVVGGGIVSRMFRGSFCRLKQLT